MNKRTRKIVTWITLIIMVLGIAGGILAYAIA
mgnify:CR=1 FL=1